MSTDYKRRRKDDVSQQVSSKFSASKIFSPFRTVGLVSNSTPLAITSLGQSFTITTSVGRSFQIYDASTLHLLFVSSQTPSKIQCLKSHFHYVFAAWQGAVGIFKRGRLESTIDLQQDVEIKDILVFGEYLCIASDTKLHVFKINTKNPTQNEYYTTFNLPGTLGKIRQLVHIPTYLNKLLIVTDSLMVLFNVRSSKVVYTFQEFEAEIAAVEAAPVLDIAAVATITGKVFIYNLKKAKVLFELSLNERINTMSFRTDGTAHLGIGTASGHMFFYDLNSRKRLHSVRNTHNEDSGGVSKMAFLNGQPIVVSNGGDNNLQELVFDPTITSSNTAITTPPRVLRSRGGHSKPPTTISFTDEEGHFLLSASQDQSLWNFSLRKDSQSQEFSQRVSNNKRKTSQTRENFPAITSIDYRANKQRRWDNVITAHQNTTFARTWSGDRGIIGQYKLETADKGIVKSVFITQCGNFALVGSSGGSISIYNLQSGKLKTIVSKVHKKAVTGIAVDAVNKTIISVSLDGKMALHNFKTGRLINTVQFESSATDLVMHGPLAAAAIDNLSIVVVDIATCKIVRELWGHSNRITSYDFTPDGRWIISAALDATIRTWDLPSGGCIDAVKVPSVVTCLRISPTGEWLATAHVQGVGVQLWTRKSQFAKSFAARHIDEDEINEMSMPTASGEGGVNVLEGAFDQLVNDDETNNEYGNLISSFNQLGKDLLTMSTLPRAKYNTLVHLDTIKQRNKPSEAPKKPVKLPFFLGASAEKKENEQQEAEENEHKMKGPTNGSYESKFTQLLRDDHTEFIKHLKTLSPSTTDLEIRSLRTDDDDLSEFTSFIDALTKQLVAKQDYELVQAWMAMLLRVHGDVILANGPILEASLRQWEVAQQAEAERLEALVKYCSGVLSFLRSL